MWLTSGPLRQMYDCCVIGSGPAGVTLALELAKANKTVLLFESGTATDARADMPNGGTSKVWSGWCITLRERDFDNPAVGVRWPITRPELVPYYRRAAEVLDRDASIVDVETPLVPGFIYRPFSRAEGDPTRFGLKYFDVLEKSSTIHVALASSVVGLDADTSRSAVQTLTYFHHSSGTTHRLALDPAQPIVLAGGGISNAQLLLQPRSDGAVPVGNESGQAGKFLMEHPHFYRVAELVLDEDLDRQPPDNHTADYDSDVASATKQ